jgi:hypothetical protein
MTKKRKQGMMSECNDEEETTEVIDKNINTNNNSNNSSSNNNNVTITLNLDDSIIESASTNSIVVMSYDPTALSDIIIKHDTGTYHAHKYVLQLHSEYFKKLFLSDTTLTTVTLMNNEEFTFLHQFLTLMYQPVG